jgi:hypothetical protein
MEEDAWALKGVNSLIFIISLKGDLEKIEDADVIEG